MCETVTVLRLSVSQSFCPFNVPEFFVSTLIFSEKASVWPYDCKQLLVTPPIIMSYSREQIASLLPAIVLHCTILSGVYRSTWSFPLKLLVRWCHLYVKLLI